MEKIYNKLVRDGIPEIIKSNGGQPFCHELSDREFEEALNDKLFEELKEVCEATGRERLEELADIYELIRTIAELHDSSMENVARLANKKKKERGAFEKKIFTDAYVDFYRCGYIEAVF